MIVKPLEIKPENKDKIINFIEEQEKTQVVDIDSAFSHKNVEHAVLETKRAFKENKNISRDEKIELLIRLTAERQIKKAIEKAKVKEEKAVFICFNDEQRKTWEKFKEKFMDEETRFPKRNLDEVKEKMEQTATFWLK